MSSFRITVQTTLGYHDWSLHRIQTLEMALHKGKFALITYIWDLGGLVVHSGGHTESSEEPESSAQPRQRLILSTTKHTTNQPTKSSQIKPIESRSL